MKTVKLPYQTSMVVLSLLLFISLSYSAEYKDRVTKNHSIITQQEWSVPKSVQDIISLPALQSALTQISKNKNSNLLIRYPGGEVGILWATELKAWLVALGLDSNRMTLQSGSHKIHELEIIVQ